MAPIKTSLTLLDEIPGFHSGVAGKESAETQRGVAGRAVPCV